jgi:hypothetical protein
LIFLTRFNSKTLLTLYPAFYCVMQRNVKNKIWFFTFGLFAGVTIGVVFGVAIKALLSHMNALHLSINKIDNREDKISQRLDSIEGKLSDQNKKMNAAVVSKNNVTKTITASPESINPASDASDSSTKITDGVDSIDVGNNQPDSNVNVVVMTNQLVTISSVPVINLDTASAKKSIKHTDSLIANMSEVAAIPDPSNYRIEFWQSPLNFKGYKMSKGKLILYGINSTSPVKLVKWDDAFYLLANQTAYHIDYTDDFRPFERVADKSVLKKLSL